jgi:large subunit ribosomal protein L17
MKKNVFGRKLSRDANERKALFKTLASSLVMSESITTTEAKAKAIRPYVEKLVTKAKRRKLGARQFIEPNLSKEATDKLLMDTSLRFTERNGGYTRIIRLGNRFADNAPVVKIEWVDKTPIKIEKKETKKVKKAAAKTSAKTPTKKTVKKIKTVKKNEK